MRARSLGVRLILPFLLGTQHVSDICYCMKCMNVKTPFLKCCSHIDSHVAGLVVFHSYHYSMLYPIYDSLLCFMSCLSSESVENFVQRKFAKLSLRFLWQLAVLDEKVKYSGGWSDCT